MSFTADKQTLDDLNLLGKYKSNSIYSLFNQVHTDGGERLLQDMFQHPLTGVDEINVRSNIFRYFQEKKLSFPFSNHLFTKIDNYLSSTSNASYPAALAGLVYQKMQASFLHDEQFGILKEGLSTTIQALKTLKQFLGQLEQSGAYQKEYTLLVNILNDERLQRMLETKSTDELSLPEMARYDHLLKFKLREQMDTLLESVYKLDVYIAVSSVARERGFEYAQAFPPQVNLLRAAAVWHPALLQGVANPFDLHQQQNMIFLTGANMAGKSTLMKSFGIAVYLSHMGFPVAAKNMEFSVSEGLYSSINVPDNLNMGYSHFYAEVLRVKQVAEEVSSGKNLVVLFDELFKGTNVKDAYDATLAVTEAFSKYSNCLFIISTHIIEVGEELQKKLSPIQFSFLPTVMEGNIPRYTYLLQEGITTDRQGMTIIENEGILELLRVDYSCPGSAQQHPAPQPSVH